MFDLYHLGSSRKCCAKCLLVRNCQARFNNLELSWQESRSLWKISYGNFYGKSRHVAKVKINTHTGIREVSCGVRNKSLDSKDSSHSRNTFGFSPKKSRKSEICKLSRQMSIS